LDTPLVYQYQLVYYYGGADETTFKVDTATDYADPFGLTFTVIAEGTVETVETVETVKTVEPEVATDSKSISNAAFETAKEYLLEDLPPFIIMPLDSEDPVTFTLRTLAYVKKNGASSQLKFKIDLPSPLDEFIECNESTGECEVSPSEKDHVGEFEASVALKNSYGREIELLTTLLITSTSSELDELEGLLSKDGVKGKDGLLKDGFLDDFEGELDLDGKFEEDEDEKDDIREGITDPEELERLDEERQFANEEESKNAIDALFSQSDEEDEGERTIELVMKLSSGAEIDIEINPDELASDPTKLAELFDSADIASLDLSEKQGLFKDLLSVKTSFQDAKASFEGVTKVP